MFLALNASQAGGKENELKSTDKNILNEIMWEAVQSKISALEDNLKKTKGITII